MVSGLHRFDLPDSASETRALLDLIQADPAISPGNSGGAMVDASGRALGIRSRSSRRSKARYGRHRNPRRDCGARRLRAARARPRATFLPRPAPPRSPRRSLASCS
ncbi:MAG: hypothetical protein ACRDPA_14725 [Solirubrobacteraceae bacterium]